MVPNVESVYGITSKVVTTTIGVKSVPQRKNIFAKSNSSSWLLRNFGFKIRNYHKKIVKLRNSNVKKQFGGYPGTHWFLGIKIYLQELFGWCNYRNYYFVSIYLLVGLGRIQSENQNLKSSLNQKSKCAVVSGIQKTKNSISSRMNSKLNLPIISFSQCVLHMFNFKPGIRVVKI